MLFMETRGVAASVIFRFRLDDDTVTNSISIVPCFVHGSSGIVSRKTLISVLKDQEHHSDFPPALTNAKLCLQSLSVHRAC